MASAIVKAKMRQSKAAAAQRVLARQNGPTVLVGHSFAGIVITEAAASAHAALMGANQKHDDGSDHAAALAAARSTAFSAAKSSTSTEMLFFPCTSTSVTRPHDGSTKA